jgi:hypothetical protein
MRKVRISIALCLVAATAFVAAPPVASQASSMFASADIPEDYVPPATGRPIVFYAPHQDDETLFMGQIIAHHVLAGREVHVVLVTAGDTGIVHQDINGTREPAKPTDPATWWRFNPWWGDLHYPEREGYEPLTKEEFGAARDREFIAAAGALGVRPENIHIDRPLPSGVAVADAKAAISKWADHFAARGFQQVGHYTMHWADPNGTHATIGTALRELALTGDVKYGDVRWMVKPEEASKVGASQYVPPANLQPLIKRMARRATIPYCSWAPNAGMYAVGCHSIGKIYVDAVVRGDYNYRVVSPGGSAQRTASRLATSIQERYGASNMEK